MSFLEIKRTLVDLKDVVRELRRIADALERALPPPVVEEAIEPAGLEALQTVQGGAGAQEEWRSYAPRRNY